MESGVYNTRKVELRFVKLIECGSELDKLGDSAQFADFREHFLFLTSLPRIY